MNAREVADDAAGVARRLGAEMVVIVVVTREGEKWDGEVGAYGVPEGCVLAVRRGALFGTIKGLYPEWEP